MPNYLGEFKVLIKNTPYCKYTKKDWAMYFIASYGQIDGAHHKNWVLDQVARILNGTPIIVTLAKWDEGKQEYRVVTGKPSKEYQSWAKQMRGVYDKESNEYEYIYDEGIAP